jgi:hypothetical protein
MKTLVLSDHTQDKVQEASHRRQAAYQAETQKWRSAIASRQKVKEERYERVHIAWRDRRWWGFLKSVLALIFGRLPHVPKRPILQAAGRDEIIFAAGSEGETRVREHLARRLGEEWTAITGYRSAKGEIDLILVGPTGVFAIEVKFLNGVVYCDGDQWWLDRFDNYGNLVQENLPIEDRGGRAPSRQVNEPADCLQVFLRQRLGDGRVTRAVVLAHEKSEVGDMANQTVDLVTTLDGWNLSSFLTRDSTLDSAMVGRLVETIRQDHAHHASRSVKRGIPRPERASAHSA